MSTMTEPGGKRLKRQGRVFPQHQGCQVRSSGQRQGAPGFNGQGEGAAQGIQRGIGAVDHGDVGKIAQGGLEAVHGYVVQNQGPVAADIRAALMAPAYLSNP